MFCRNCGAELKEGSAFCGNCGARVFRVTSNQNGTAEQNPAGQSQNRSGQNAAHPGAAGYRNPAGNKRARGSPQPAYTGQAAVKKSPDVKKIGIIALVAVVAIVLVVFAGKKGGGGSGSNYEKVAKKYASELEDLDFSDVDLESLLDYFPEEYEETFEELTEYYGYSSINKMYNGEIGDYYSEDYELTKVEIKDFQDTGESTMEWVYEYVYYYSGGELDFEDMEAMKTVELEFTESDSGIIYSDYEYLYLAQIDGSWYIVYCPFLLS